MCQIWRLPPFSTPFFLRPLGLRPPCPPCSGANRTDGVQQGAVSGWRVRLQRRFPANLAQAPPRRRVSSVQAAKEYARNDGPRGQQRRSARRAIAAIASLCLLCPAGRALTRCRPAGCLRRPISPLSAHCAAPYRESSHLPPEDRSFFERFPPLCPPAE